jgi:hypothetical protein
MLLLHNHHCHTATMLTQPARGPVSHARPVQNEPKVQTAKRCARQLRIFLLSAVFAGSLHVTSTARYRRAAVALSFCSLSLAASLPLPPTSLSLSLSLPPHPPTPLVLCLSTMLGCCFRSTSGRFMSPPSGLRLKLEVSERCMICSCMMCASDLDQHIVHACIARVIPPIVQA